jgi:hypothetical protein
MIGWPYREQGDFISLKDGGRGHKHTNKQQGVLITYTRRSGKN